MSDASPVRSPRPWRPAATPRSAMRSCRRGSPRPGARPPGLIGALSTRRSQGHRPPLHRHRVRLPVPRRACRPSPCALQLARPESGLIGPDLYNQLFTMHGTTMMFLFAVPIDGGVGGLPRAADGRHAQHRLPAPQRLQLLGLSVRRSFMIWLSFMLNIGPDVGWFAYVPLSGPGILARQARRRLGADDHLHRGVGTRRGGRDHRHRAQAARAGHDARPHSALRLGRCWSPPS